MVSEMSGDIHNKMPPFSPYQKHLPMLLLLFFGSGCSALIYEVVWFQMLQLVIGSSAVSLGVLLGTYMGGMLLGSIALPNVIPLKSHPLRVYALIEMGIGIIGVAVLFGMPYVDRIYIGFIGHGFAGILLRGAVCAMILLPPTILMGATLPVVARWIEITPQGVSWLGFLYGGNIAGAVFGCLMAGFYLLMVHDMATATYVAVAINGIIALVSIIMAVRTSYRGSVFIPAHGYAARVPWFWVVYIVISLSGLCAMGAEVVWTRLLSLILGGTVYTFSIILAAFLIGLGIGSGIGSFLSRKITWPGIALGCCQMLLTAAIAWAAHINTGFLPYWPIYPSPSTSHWLNFMRDLLSGLWIILPAAILWGASFPLALAAVASRGHDPGRLVGEVYAVNTFGAVIGAIGFSMIVIPWMGTQQAQQLMIVLSGVAAIIMFATFLRPVSANVLSVIHSRLQVLFVPVALAVVLWFVVFFTQNVAPTEWGMIAYGRFLPTWISRLVPGITAEQDIPFDSDTLDIFCTYAGEGMNESVVVTMSTYGVQNFHCSGKVQASSQPADMRLQRMLGHIPALIQENPETVLVVACGAGVTAGTFVLYPSIKRIVICEIEQLVPKFVAPKFENENYGVINDTRTEVIYDDGRHYINTTKEKFDIITSDPIDPWIKGSATLYTEEYFTICKKHLNPGGVMTLWIPFYESSSESVKSLVATFFNVFPDGIIWSNDSLGKGYDAVLFGQNGTTKINVDELQKRLEYSEYLPVNQSLAQVDFSSAIDLFATFAGSAPRLTEWLNDAQINNDRNLRLQYLAGLALNSYDNDVILNEIIQSYTFPDELFSGSEESIRMLRQAIEREN